MTKYVKVSVTTQYNIIRVVKPYRYSDSDRFSSSETHEHAIYAGQSAAFFLMLKAGDVSTDWFHSCFPMTACVSTGHQPDRIVCVEQSAIKPILRDNILLLNIMLLNKHVQEKFKKICFQTVSVSMTTTVRRSCGIFALLVL